jgi:hypothetical protein
MRRGVVAFSGLALVGLTLAGCGIVRYQQREAWRTQAEESCLAQKLVVPTAYMALSPPIDGPGACGISHPFKVAAFAGGEVALRQPVTLGCPIIPSIDGWVEEVVQPAAELYFGARVVEVRSGSYSCRGVNNQRTGKLSEHAFGNAVDIMSFRFADGRDLTVERGWRGAPVEQEFLRELFVGACRYFTTVLGPGADPFHYNHFHLDLARHGARGERRVCKPLLKFEPRLEAAGATQNQSRALPPRPQSAPQARPEPEDLDEIDEDNDPFAVSSHQSGAARSSVAQSASRAPAARDAEPAYGGRPAAAYSSASAAPRAPAPPTIAAVMPPPRPLPGSSVAGLRPPEAAYAAAPPPPPQRPLVLQPQLWSGGTLY